MSAFFVLYYEREIETTQPTQHEAVHFTSVKKQEFNSDLGKCIKSN